MTAQSAEMAVAPFRVMDCALVAIATGNRAQNLREFRDGLMRVPDESIYYHIWGRLLRPRFDEPEFLSDFAAWAHHALHDDVLAERLAVLDPADFADVEVLRQELIEVIEQRMEEVPFLAWTKPDQQFHFRRGQTVVFDTGRQLDSVRDLAEALPDMSLGSIYYHIIDARRRQPIRRDDFQIWLELFGERTTEIRARLAAVDPYFSTLAGLRDRYTEALRREAAPEPRGTP